MNARFLTDNWENVVSIVFAQHVEFSQVNGCTRAMAENRCKFVGLSFLRGHNLIVRTPLRIRRVSADKLFLTDTNEHWGFLFSQALPKKKAFIIADWMRNRAKENWPSCDTRVGLSCCSVPGCRPKQVGIQQALCELSVPSPLQIIHSVLGLSRTFSKESFFHDKVHLGSTSYCCWASGSGKQLGSIRPPEERLHSSESTSFNFRLSSFFGVSSLVATDSGWIKELLTDTNLLWSNHASMKQLINSQSKFCRDTSRTDHCSPWENFHPKWIFHLGLVGTFTVLSTSLHDGKGVFVVCYLEVSRASHWLSPTMKRDLSAQNCHTGALCTAPCRLLTGWCASKTLTLFLRDGQMVRTAPITEWLHSNYGSDLHLWVVVARRDSIRPPVLCWTWQGSRLLGKWLDFFGSHQWRWLVKLVGWCCVAPCAFSWRIGPLWPFSDGGRDQ